MRVLGLLTFLFFAFPALAQSDAKVLLVDEFEHVLCDDFLARVDNFYLQLNHEPTATGYFVITGSNEFLRTKLTSELLFESAVGWRNFDRARTEIVRGPETGPLKVKLWIVKAGVEIPDFGKTKWSLRLVPGTPPFLLRSDMAQICDPPPIQQVASELLDSNHDGSIFVVVHGPTPKQRKSELRLAAKNAGSL